MGKNNFVSKAYIFCKLRHVDAMDSVTQVRNLLAIKRSRAFNMCIH